MKIKRYYDLDSYMNDTFLFLSKYELQNNLIIGNCIRAKKNNLNVDNYFLAAVLDYKDNIKTILMQTPPYPLLIFEVDNIPCNDGIETAIKYIISNNINLPGVVTEKELGKRFVDKYTSMLDVKVKEGMKMRIYQLDEVKYRPDINGKLRLATTDDLYFLPYWSDAFVNECEILISKDDINSRAEKIKAQINASTLYIYEDKYPVSQIACGRETLSGAVINNVYTPPFFRRKGYATAMVADLCTKLLADGYKFCSLFTDLSNPISNSIYQKVGFYPICDYDEYWFERK